MNKENPFILGNQPTEGYVTKNAGTSSMLDGGKFVGTASVCSKHELANCEECQRDCKHEDMKLVGAIANTHLCFKCGGQLLANEIEILNTFYEIGVFCDNEKCERFLLLVV